MCFSSPQKKPKLISSIDLFTCKVGIFNLDICYLILRAWQSGRSEQITVLLNGINICDAQTGHNSFDFPVDISEIERIEVLEGPAARVYGTSPL